MSFLIATAISGSAFGQSTTAAGGGAFTLVVKSDGTLWAFGLNNNGQLADNTTTTRRSPQQVAGLANIQAVAAGGVHAMALTSSGSLYVWGDNLYSQVGDATTTDRKTPVLLSLSGVTAIAAGEFHSLALTSTGNLYAWGRNNFGQIGNGSTTNVSTPTLVLTGVVAIGAGRNHSLAVKNDGSAWAWGANGAGQLGTNTTSTGATSTPVQMLSLSGASKIAGGEAHSLILMSDGTVKGAGENGAGQLADTTSTDRWTAITVGTVSNVAQIVSGLDHAFARLSDGSLWGWGENTGGELGLGAGNTTDQRTPVEISSLSGVGAIAAGWNHSISITTSGVVSTWGANASSQLGEGTTAPRSLPTAISDTGYAWRVATPVFSVASGTYNVDKTVVVTVDTSGSTIHYTQNGADPTETDPTVASGATITVSSSQTLKARAWKAGMPSGEIAAASYILQVATPAVSPTSTTYTTPQNVTMSTTTAGAALRYTIDGTDPTESSTAYSGAINVAHTTTFRIIGFKSGWAASAVRVSTYTMNFGTLAVPIVDPATGAYTGSVAVSMSSPQSGATIRHTTNNTAPSASSPAYTGAITLNTTTTVRAKVFHPDYTTSAETSRTYTLTTHTPTLGSAAGSYAPGSTVTITAGQPPTDTLRMTVDGSDPTTTSPMVASGTTILLGNFTLKAKAWRSGAADSTIASAAYTLDAPLGPGSAAAGGTHALLATPDGRVIEWGENGSSQLGNESTVDRTAPTTLNSLTGVTAVSGGLAHTLARTWDGQLYAWGSNGSGRLGDGTTTNRNKPTLITTLSNIVAIAAGDAHSLALSGDGHIYVWGENSSGQLGLGSATDTPTPTQIASLSNVVAIAAGDNHSLAVTSSGQLYAWGDNINGQIGDGTSPTDRTSPVLINLSNVVAIAAGDKHSLAMTQGGAAYSWGLGSSGQLGRGNTSNTSTPTVISGLHVSAIAAGDLHSAALRGDGVLVAWGANAASQIGDTTTTQRNAPVVVSGPSSISSIALGDAFSFVVTPDGDAWTWGAGASGQLADGGVANRSTPQSVFAAAASWAPSAPTISVPSGTYANTQSVTVSSRVPGAVIRYTLTGADPTESDDQLTSGSSLDVAYSAFFRARAFVEGRAAGKIARADYELQSVAPVIDPPTATYTAAQTVSITASGPPSVIRYTTDGSDPTSTSAAYAQPFVVSTSQTIKTRAFPTNGWPASGASSASLALNYGQLAAPTSTPPGGAFPAAQTVALSAAAGAAIRFTTNGSDPTPWSPIYSSAIDVPTGTVTIKARAYHPDWTTSDAMTEAFSIDIQAPTIVGRRFPSAFNGWHLTPVTVTFVCTDNIAVASCTSPATISIEGIGQTAIGTAVDTAGRETTITETLNLDLTPPVVTLTSPADAFVTTSDAVTVTGTASDALSGLAAVMCNGIATSVVDGQVSCTVALGPGRNTVAISSLDVAGHSASAAITISRVGTAPSSLTMTPNARTMVVGEQMPLALRDTFGSAISGAMWSSTDPAVLSLSTDDPPTLKAVAPGNVVVSAVKDGFDASSVITVIDTDIAAGQQQWSSALPSSPNQVEESPIYAHPIEAMGPDVFTVAVDTTTGERSVWPMTAATGEAHAMLAAPGRPLLGDVFGGLIAGVEPASTVCSGLLQYTMVEQKCYEALVRFAAPASTLSWRYESHGVLDRPAQGPDGTIYVTEHVEQNGLNVDHRSVVVLDGATGAVKTRIPLANSYSWETSNGICKNSYAEFAPFTIGPIVAGDGAAYILVSQIREKRDWICSQQYPIEIVNQTDDIGFRVLRISSDGDVTETMLDDSHHVGEWLWTEPRQLLPDGIGGLLIVADHANGTGGRQRRVTHLDAESTRTDTALDSGTRIELIGQAGTAYVHRINSQTSPPTSLGKDVVDVRTWQTKWTLPLDRSWLAASPDGGAMAQNASEQLTRFDGNGQQVEVYGGSLTDPVHLNNKWIVTSGSGLVAVRATFSDATRWDETYRQLNPTERRHFGNAKRNQSLRNPGRGIFAKSHTVQEPLIFQHISIRITPTYQDFWKQLFPQYLINEDEYGNLFMTLGAGTAEGDSSFFCTGTLTKGINREKDVMVPPVQFEPLPIGTFDEIRLINDLKVYFDNYQNDLPYACVPELHPGQYNSNSFASGLLRKAGAPLPWFPIRGTVAPGWPTPVPTAKFDPQ